MFVCDVIQTKTNKDMNKETETIDNGTATASDRLFVQVTGELIRERLDGVRTNYGYDSLGQTVRNCLKVALNVYEKDPQNFLALLNS